MKIKLIYPILLLFICLPLFSQGIEFSTLESATIQKTSYSVFAHEQPEFKNYFSVKFDMAIHDPSSFGYLFRISNKASQQPDIYSLVFSDDNNRQSYLKFNIEAKECRMVDTLQNNKLGTRHWIPVTIEFHLKGDSVVMTVENKRLVTKQLGLPSFMRPSILFGSSKFSEEIPSFAIRNLYIASESASFHFPLNESRGDEVHDNQLNVVGHAINPVWLINKSYHWNLCFSLASKSVAGVSFDPDNGRIFVFNNDSLTTMDVSRNKSETLPHAPISMRMELGTSFYDPDSHLIHIYEVDNYNNSTTVSTLNIDTKECIPSSSHFLSSQRHHHSSFYDRLQKQYYIFGGFGSRKYVNEMEMYHLKTNKWKTIQLTGDTITPRFFSSMGTINDKEILLFGGTGNSSGDQSVGKIGYYDLYRINLQTGVVKKIWEITHEGQDFVPVRGLIASEDKSSFYTLCYPMQLASSQLQLYRFAIKDGKYQILGDSIPMESKAILSNANLYYNTSTQEFYCYVQEFQEHGGQHSNIRIYSLVAPAISARCLSLYSPKKQMNNWLLRTVLTILISAGGVLIVLHLFKKSKRRPLPSKQQPEETTDEQHLTAAPSFSKSIPINSLFLFGEFAVIDSKGKNITYMFSAKIKQLFLLTLLRSFNDSRGITSTTIYGALWPDKDSQSAKNLKCVSINKIRKILDELEGISFVYDDKHYKIEITEKLYCDYQEYARLINRLTTAPHHAESIEELTKILSRGRFLNSVSENVFDELKAAQEEEILTLIPFELEKLYQEQNIESVVALTNVLFAIDPLNDTALWYLLNTYHKTKKEDTAMRRYYLFTADYLKNMGTNYPHSYADFTHYTSKELINK